MKSPLLTLLLLLATPALGLADTPTFELVIKDHRFQPAALKVPAGVKFKLLIHNQDGTPEEFESYELNREKIIPGGHKAVIFIGPLKPGVYPFFGEFHEDSAKGSITAE